VPSQVPSRPQLLTGSTGHWPGTEGASPAGTKVQVPWKPGTLQDRQVSWQAELQQTPSTQAPLAHSASQAHWSPLRLSPVTAASEQTPGMPLIRFGPPSGRGTDDRS
jgi:hypothetical protein